MTGPAPIGDLAVLNMVVDTLRRVEDSLTRLSENVTMQLSRLPSDYVPRREVERRLDEFTYDLAQERLERTTALKELEAKATSHRRWLIGTSVAGVVGLTNAAVGLINHFT